MPSSATHPHSLDLAVQMDELTLRHAWKEMASLVDNAQMDRQTWAVLRDCEAMGEPSAQRDQFLDHLRKTQLPLLACNAREGKVLSWWAPAAWLDLEIAAIGGFSRESNAFLAIDSLLGAAQSWADVSLSSLSAAGAARWMGHSERERIELCWHQGVLNCLKGDSDPWLAWRSLRALGQAGLLLADAPRRLGEEFFNPSHRGRTHFLLGHGKGPEAGMAALALLAANGPSATATPFWPSWRERVFSMAEPLSAPHGAWAQAVALARSWEEREELSSAVDSRPANGAAKRASRL